MRRPETSATILVVDDDADVCGLLAQFLEARGYRVESARSAAEIDPIMAGLHVDLVILDILMPGEDGLSVCRRIARPGGPEIIFLSGLNEEVDRLVGLEAGASHYLPKPCSSSEILATVRAALRHRCTAPKVEAQQFSFDGWRIDLAAQELCDPAGVLIALTDGEFAILRAFVKSPRRVLSRLELLEAARGRGTESADRAIDIQISRIRQKLRASGNEVIRTVRNEGYLFVPKVSRTASV